MSHSKKTLVLENETNGKIFVGNGRLFAHPMRMITTVGKHLLGNGDRSLDTHLRAFSPRIMMMIMNG